MPTVNGLEGSYLLLLHCFRSFVMNCYIVIIFLHDNDSSDHPFYFSSCSHQLQLININTFTIFSFHLHSRFIKKGDHVKYTHRHIHTHTYTHTHTHTHIYIHTSPHSSIKARGGSEMMSVLLNMLRCY